MKLKKACKNDPILEDFDYPKASSTILWIARYCRVDVLYAAKELMQYNNSYDATHVRACKHLMRYLKGTLDLKLNLHQGKPGIINIGAYSDADWAGQHEESVAPMRSTTGGLIFLEGIGQIFSQSVTQKEVATSTQAAEYIAVSHLSRRIMGIKHFLEEVGFTQPEILVHEDNEACIAMAKTILMGSKGRHLSIKVHYVKELVAQGHITLVACPTTEMVADLYTKNLDKTLFTKFRNIVLGYVPCLY